MFTLNHKKYIQHPNYNIITQACLKKKKKWFINFCQKPKELLLFSFSVEQNLLHNVNRSRPKSHEEGYDNKATFSHFRLFFILCILREIYVHVSH